MIRDIGTELLVNVGGVDIARYVYRPDCPPLESPRPYLHPLRTLAGMQVTDFRPDDHRWHKGLALSLPHVGATNIWGGVTYVRDQGYVQLDNNGSMRHESFTQLAADTIAEQLTWVTPQDAPLIDERRTMRFELQSDRWVLHWSSQWTNISAEPLDFGSPATHGRPEAGYGGLFWRGPAGFTGGTIVGPDGPMPDTQAMGCRSPWLAFVGQPGDGPAATIVIADDPANPRYPTPWFARSEQFAGLCPAPFYQDELRLEPGAAVTWRYQVTITDGTNLPL